MRRMHIFEWEDLFWFPSTIRDLMTDYLRHVVMLAKLYEPVVPILNSFLHQTGTNTIIDLASGGGGAWVFLAPALKTAHQDVRVLLTDRYPNLSALYAVKRIDPAIIDVSSEPVDALCVPEHLRGVRTQFLSLHHFRPYQVRMLFEHAIEAQQPIAIFEFQQRTVAHLLQYALSPIAVLLLSLTIRPFTLKRFVFTYIVPLVPFFVMWDGIVSVLRTYDPDEVQQIIATIPESKTYIWDIGARNDGYKTMFWALGRPGIDQSPTSE